MEAASDGGTSRSMVVRMHRIVQKTNGINVNSNNNIIPFNAFILAWYVKNHTPTFTFLGGILSQIVTANPVY